MDGFVDLDGVSMEEQKLLMEGFQQQQQQQQQQQDFTVRDSITSEDARAIEAAIFGDDTYATAGVPSTVGSGLRESDAMVIVSSDEENELPVVPAETRRKKKKKKKKISKEDRARVMGNSSPSLPHQNSGNPPKPEVVVVDDDDDDDDDDGNAGFGNVATRAPPTTNDRGAAVGDWLAVLNRLTVGPNFVKEYEEMYGDTHPTMSTEPFDVILNRVTSEYGLLLAYIHYPEHDNTVPYCFGVIGTQLFAELVNDQFTFWVGQMSKGDEEQVRSTFGVQEFPCIAIMGAVGVAGSLSLLQIVQGTLSADALICQLYELVDTYKPQLEAMKKKREEQQQGLAGVVPDDPLSPGRKVTREKSAADRVIRTEQQSAYEESLLMDRQREERERMEEAEQRVVLQSVEDAQRDAHRRKEEVIERRRQKASTLPPEPAKGDKDTCHLVLRTSNGQRIERRFLKDDTVQLVFDFIDSKVDDTGLIDPGTYALVTSFPRQRITDGDKTLIELGLCPKALVHIEFDAA
eukprot:TRINITY_DN3433_c5_g1_i1.p2 TRINITY_DN3433_c5_g1~~TRINITY_DN3433_c5_g1_i1.p2  ORF type:complete len:518 (-),score=137.52 TRINITY_DN3433_c5_g1_i1:165-1718(-)